MWIQLCHLNYRGFEADRGGWNKKGTGHREVLYPRFENKPDNKDSHIADGIFHSFPCPLVLCSSHHCEAQTGLDVQSLWCRRVPTCTRSDAAPLTTFASEEAKGAVPCAFLTCCLGSAVRLTCAHLFHPLWVLRVVHTAVSGGDLCSH